MGLKMNKNNDGIENIVFELTGYVNNLIVLQVEKRLTEIMHANFIIPKTNASEKKYGTTEMGTDRKGNKYLIKLRMSQNAHNFITWEYNWKEIPKLCKKAKEELIEELLILAEKIKQENKL